MGSPTKNPKDLDDEEYYEYYDEDEKWIFLNIITF
jgi:hypothetical protein